VIRAVAVRGEPYRKKMRMQCTLCSWDQQTETLPMEGHSMTLILRWRGRFRCVSKRYKEEGSAGLDGTLVNGLLALLRGSLDDESLFGEALAGNSCTGLFKARRAS
jgi:hypothetical protein